MCRIKRNSFVDICLTWFDGYDMIFWLGMVQFEGAIMPRVVRVKYNNILLSVF